MGLWPGHEDDLLGTHVSEAVRAHGVYQRTAVASSAMLRCGGDSLAPGHPFMDKEPHSGDHRFAAECTEPIAKASGRQRPVSTHLLDL